MGHFAIYDFCEKHLPIFGRCVSAYFTHDSELNYISFFLRMSIALHLRHKSSSLLILHHFDAGTAPAQSVRRRHTALYRRRLCRSCVRIRAAAEAVRTQRPADTAGADTAAVRSARSHNWRPKLCKLCPPGGPASVPSGHKLVRGTQTVCAAAQQCGQLDGPPS